MATLADVRRIAMSLPRTTEHLIGDNTKFRVGRLVYASVSADEERIGFGFAKEERAALVASEPDKFMMPLSGDMRYQWVRARLPVLDATELRELLIDAWCMVVPKTIAARSSLGKPNPIRSSSAETEAYTSLPTRNLVLPPIRCSVVRGSDIAIRRTSSRVAIYSPRTRSALAWKTRSMTV